MSMDQNSSRVLDLKVEKHMFSTKYFNDRPSQENRPKQAHRLTLKKHQDLHLKATVGTCPEKTCRGGVDMGLLSGIDEEMMQATDDHCFFWGRSIF